MKENVIGHVKRNVKGNVRGNVKEDQKLRKLWSAGLALQNLLTPRNEWKWRAQESEITTVNNVETCQSLVNLSQFWILPEYNYTFNFETCYFF